MKSLNALFLAITLIKAVSYKIFNCRKTNTVPYPRSCLRGIPNDIRLLILQSISDPKERIIAFINLSKVNRSFKLFLENNAQAKELYINSIAKLKKNPPAYLLFWAATNDCMLLAQYILNKNVNIHSKDELGNTPLHLAAKKGNMTMAKLLLDKNANIHAKNNDGYSPFHYAAKFGNLGIAKLLFNSGANIEAHNLEGFTPLHSAAQCGWTSIVKFLLDRGTNIHSKIQYERKPLSFAIDNGYIKIAKIILSHGSTDPSIKKIPNDCFYPLHWAARKGLISLVESLIDKGAKIDHRDLNGYTALHYAAQNGHLAVAEFLLKNLSNKYARTKLGKLPLSLASNKGHTAVARLLIKKGWGEKETSRFDKNSFFPVYGTARLGEKNLELLINTGTTSIHKRDPNGCTLLHYAAEFGYISIVRLLLNKGANKCRRNKSYQNPLCLASINGHTAVAKLLIRHGRTS